jgi:hypothetical protein
MILGNVESPALIDSIGLIQTASDPEPVLARGGTRHPR